MAVSLLLLAVLEQHCCGEDERYVDAYDSERAGEDRVEEGVGEGDEGGHATNVSSCCESSRTCGVRDESGRCAVVVAAAVELFPVSIFHSRPHFASYYERGTYPLLQKTLCGVWLHVPDVRQVLAGLERLEPDGETDDHREDRADDDQVAMEFEPASRRGNNHRWYGD